MLLQLPVCKYNLQFMCQCGDGVRGQRSIRSEDIAEGDLVGHGSEGHGV